MNTPNDSRINVVFAPASSAREGDAILSNHDIVPPPGVVVIVVQAAPGRAAHVAGCACCARPAVSGLLTAAFVAQARAGRPPFRRLVVDAGEETAAALRGALESDAFVAGRYVAR